MVPFYAVLNEVPLVSSAPEKHSPMDPLLSKFTGCLIGVAVGDSLGARNEGATVINDDMADLSPRYTDDTVMTIGVAESLAMHKDFHYWHMTDRLMRLHERSSSASPPTVSGIDEP